MSYSGADIFQYSIIDQSGAVSNTGTVNLSISVYNAPPTATATGFTTNEDAPFAGSLT